MIRRQTLSLLVIICLGHVLLISAQVQSKSGLPVVESVAFGVFSRAQSLLAGAADGVSGVWTNYFALRGAARENARLQERLLEAEARFQEQQALANRARSLEDALSLRQSLTVPTLSARVIAGNPSPGSLTVTIDRGTDDGVMADMAVLGARGVVGRVIMPIAKRAATVQLLTDRLAGVAVTFERSNAGGMVVGGEGDPPFRTEFVPASADIQAGERVTTSGQDGIFPQGFLVGTVDRVNRSGSGEREIVVRPAVDFSHIDIVLVVTEPPSSRPAVPAVK